MPLTIGTLSESVSSTYGLIGHYTSSTAGTTHTITSANLGGPSGLLAILMTTPTPSGAFTATVAGGAVSGFRTTNTSGAASQFLYGRVLDTSGNISVTFTNSIADVIFTVFRLDTAVSVTRDQSANTTSSGTSVTFSTLSISSTSGGSHLLIASTQLNTNAISFNTGNLNPSSVQSGTISTIATRRHFWWYGRAGTTSAAGTASSSWTNATSGAILGISINP